MGRYDTNSSPHGICLIFSNANFHTWGPLAGIEVCKQKPVDLFQELDFNVVVKENLSKDEIQATAVEFAGKDHSQFNAFVFIILSHGGKHDVVYGVDKMAIPVKDLMRSFEPVKCHDRQDKLKLFFIDACKGLHFDLNPLVRPPASQSTSFLLPHSGTNLSAGVSPQEADFLLAFATTPDHVSKGSRYITVSLSI